MRLYFLLGALAFAQSPAPMAFDVASIKPSDPAQPTAIRRSGFRIAFINSSLEMLVTWAFDIHSDRVVGKPKWLDSVHYDIVANGPPDTMDIKVPGQIAPLQFMMQTLLADRFQLAAHRETRDMPMYALVVAKTGPKVHLTAAPEVMGQNPFRVPGLGRLIGTQVSAEMLCNVLSGELGRSVQDQTGLKGVFDFTMKWQPDTDSIRTGVSLFTALEEQLGFKLESRKGQVEVLVLDRIAPTPTEN